MKDAKGHGSNSRGGSMSVPDKHQHRIAVDTVKNPMKGMFLGGPNAAEAEATLRGKFGYNDADIAKLTGGSAPVTPPGRPIGGSAVRGIADQPDTVTDKQAAASLAQGGAKSGAVPVHSGAGGWASSGAIPRGMGSRGGGPPSFETWPSSSTKRK